MSQMNSRPDPTIRFVPCILCDGGLTKVIAGKPCPLCNGHGVIPAERERAIVRKLYKAAIESLNPDE